MDQIGKLVLKIMYVTETTYLHFKIHETCKKTKISKLNSVKNELR